MRNFKQNNRFSGGGDGGGRVMHQVVCSECGKDCEVPFKPTGDKPVFCNDCFRNKGNAQPRRFDRKDSGRFNTQDRIMYKAVCDKCGKDCEVPFKPTGNKPIYCNQCFGRGGKDKDKGSSQVSGQFDVINAKLDQILKVLSIDASIKTDVKKKIVKKPIKKAKVSNPKQVSKSKVKKTVSPKKVKAKTKSKNKK